MSQCLCCQKDTEGTSKYHAGCLKKLFGTNQLPKIPFSVKDMPRSITEKAGKMSISGVQIKASVARVPDTNEIEIVVEGGTHILKPEPVMYPELPQNENLCMNIAAAFGMETPPHGLFEMADGKLCYLIKRFDRLANGEKLHNESMFQILSAEEKYSGSLEQIANAILKHSKNVGLDAVNFFERVLLCFVLGNGDMHLKNWGLIETSEGTHTLAPCYDLVCSKVYIPKEDESALTLNGKKNRIKRTDFIALAEKLSIGEKSALNVFEKFQEMSGQIEDLIHRSELSKERMAKVKDIVRERYKQIFKTP